MRHENRRGTFLNTGRDERREIAPAEGGTVLLVGFDPSGDRVRGAVSCSYRQFFDLDGAGWNALAPAVVVAPLVARSHDAAEVAAFLAARRFAGRLLVLCPDLPDPGVVRRDLEKAAPGLALELLLPEESSACPPGEWRARGTPRSRRCLH